MKIDILICTIDEGIRKVSNVLQPPMENVRYVVSHQYHEEKFKYVPEELKREDILISQIPGYGLSRNRNHAMSLAEGDIALIADDDVRYLPDAIDHITRIYDDNPDIHVACFKIKTPDGEPEYKDYATENMIITTKKRHHYFSSVEISFRIHSIRKAGVKFDERFGLGSDRIPAGEEAVFVHDCLKAGLKTAYFPCYIVQHPYTGTGRRTKPVDSWRNVTGAAYHARVMGWKAFPIAFLVTVKRFPALIRHKRNPLKYLFERLSIINYIYQTNCKYKTQRPRKSNGDLAG